ncbi:MAG TPA: ACT domain-containing protein [Candidatus Omnitrophota bacterium]|nr:ACT domain-containing protein [Candidatus Omnitrophota bacterium]
MKLVQISVFLENKQGRLSEVAALLGKGGINIRALTVAENEGFGVLRIVVDKPEAAMQLLKNGGLVAKPTDIVAVEVDDRPGGLARVLEVLSQAGINVEYMYGFLEKLTDKALLVFRFDDPDQAIEVLKKNRVKVVSSSEMAGL